MKKINKKSSQLVNMIFKASIKANGSIDEKKILAFIKSLRKLSISESLPIIEALNSKLKNQINQTTLSIESAVSLSAILEKQIVDILKKDFKIVSVNKQITPSLLGGTRVRIGDTLLDNSILGKVNQVKEKITNV
jgi:F-type H+-transporting ATPase subunit delta